MNNKNLNINCIKNLGVFKLNIELNIAPSFTAIFGASGAGKTTLLNLISGLTRLDAGSIEWDGHPLSDHNQKIHIPPHKRGIGYIFQDSRLFPHKSVIDNLKYGWRLTPENQRRFSVDEAIDVLQLKPFLQRRPASLSGGEKQRVALGRALLASPDLLLMDEPLAALDRGTKLRLLSYLKDIHNIFNLPILYVSHDLTTVVNFAKDAISINKGKVNVITESWKAILEDSTGSLSGDIENIFKAKVKTIFRDRGTAELDTGEFSLITSDANLKEGDQVMVEIPSSEIILATSNPKGLSARNVIKGNIQAMHTVNNRCLVDINIGRRITSEILQNTKTELGLAIGMEIYVIIKAKCIHLIND